MDDFQKKKVGSLVGLVALKQTIEKVGDKGVDTVLHIDNPTLTTLGVVITNALLKDEHVLPAYFLTMKVGEAIRKAYPEQTKEIFKDIKNSL